MDSTKLCILGCGGFIGSHLLDRVLADPSYTVIGIDKSAEKIKRHLSNSRLDFTLGDIYTMEAIATCVEQSDIVLSLAALCNPSLYNTIPLRVLENNYSQPSAIVKVCAEQKKRLIHFSTCEVYGRTAGSYVSGPHGLAVEPFNEDRSPYVLGPISAQRWTYACAKQLLERLIYAYGFERGLEYTIVRPFNFIGPRMDFIPGIDGEGVPRVIACFMEALLFNTPLKLVDGGFNRRAFTAISDAIDAIMGIIKNPEKSKNQIFNIGNPANETTIADLARRMKRIYQKLSPKYAGQTIDIVNVSSEEFYGKGYEDSDRRIPDISKARELLQWEPKTSLDDALSLTIESYVREYGARAIEENPL
jgi:UDP-apiose/xylose synthase